MYALQTLHSGSNSALVILGLMAVIPKGLLRGCILYKLGKKTIPAVKDLPSENTNKRGEKSNQPS